MPLIQSANVQVATGGTVPGGITSGNGIPGTQAPGAFGPAATPPAGLPQTGSATQASITNLLFSDVVDMNGQPGAPTTVFSAGTKTVFATYDYSGFQNGQTFSYSTLRPGNNRVSQNLTWSNGPQGHSFVNLSDENGLAEGSYVLTLALDGVQLATGTFTVGGDNGGSQGGSQAAGGAPTTGPVVFAEDMTPDGRPVRPHGPGQPFSPQTTEVYAIFPYNNMPAGTNNTLHMVLRRHTNCPRFVGQAGRQWHLVRTNYTDDNTPLDQGHYRYEVDLPGGQVAAQGEFDLGSQSGAPTPATSNTGVQVVGSVTDADTGRPIANVLVVSLVPGTNPQTFLATPSESLVFSTGRTDTQGHFTLTPPWARGSTYYVVAGTNGYQPAVSNTPFAIDQNTETLYEVTIQLHQAQ